MIGRWRTILLQALLLMLILTVGIWVRAFRLNAEPPTPAESDHIRLIAECSETGTAIVSGTGGKTFFHTLSGGCVRFMGGGRWSLPVSYYRLVPLAASVLTLSLVLGLGLRRRGGLFESPDAVLWGTALIAVSPGMVSAAWSVGPASTQMLCFAGLLLTMRSYAQWPGMTAAALFGVLAALSAAVGSEGLWTLTVLLPAVVMGVGWRRICLYWRTWHIVLTLCCGVAFLAFLCRMGVATLPPLPEVPTAFLRELADRVVNDCLCGLALIAWGWVAVWAFLGAERRFARVIALLFLFSFWASFCFEGGGPFVPHLAVLSPLILAIALSTLSSPTARWAVGHLVLALVCAMLLCAVCRCRDGGVIPRSFLCHSSMSGR